MKVFSPSAATGGRGRRSRGTTAASMLAGGALALTASLVAPPSAALAASAVAPAAARATAATPEWVSSWGVPMGFAVDPMASSSPVSACATSCTLRNSAHLSVGGTSVRVTLSNAFGTDPLVVQHTTVSTPINQGAAASSAVAGSVQDVTFDGQATVTIPAGETVTSDAIARTVPANFDLQVSVYLVGPTKVPAHDAAHHQTYLRSGTDITATTTGADFGGNNGQAYVVSGVDVGGSTAEGSIVALGDSITDGSGTSDWKSNRWLDRLGERLRNRADGGPLLGVVNSGIAGNRVLLDGNNAAYGPAALTRFDRDVLGGHSGVKTLLLFEGINDIQQTPAQTDASKIIDGLQDIADRAHAAGLRVVGATITPWKGWATGSVYDTGEQVRQTVNAWIRTTNAYDAFVDFDAAVRDPADNAKLLADYDSGDHLHPNVAGNQAMADAVRLGALTPPTVSGAHDAGWVGAWAAAPAQGGSFGGCADCTIRSRAHLSIGGDAARVVLSNVWGSTDLTIAHTTVSTPVDADGAAAQPGSVQDVTFDGQASVTIPAGSSVRSDSIPGTFTADTDLQVSTYTPTGQRFDKHVAAQHTTYRASGGDQSAATSSSAFGSGSETSGYVLSGIEVHQPTALGTLVTLGDSITDGSGSTFAGNDRWPDDLARRLQGLSPEHRYGVVNAGIGANRILRTAANGNNGGQAALGRFDRDVLGQVNVKTLLVLEGINDIQIAPQEHDATKIEAGLTRIAQRAHDAGVRVVVSTILPYGGHVNFGPNGEATRQAVNAWIRTTGPSVFDAVVDLDAVVVDPASVANPDDYTLRKLRADYDSGDHIHPSALGFAAMADAIDLALLESEPVPVSVTMSAPTSVGRGDPLTVSATVTAQQAAAASSLTLHLPSGWSASTPTTVAVPALAAGGTVDATWTVTTSPSSPGVAHVMVQADIDGRATSAERVLSVTPKAPEGTRYLSDLVADSVSVGYGVLHLDEDMNGNTIDVGGTTFPKGIVANAPATFSYYLGGACSTLTTTVGVDPGAGTSTSGTVTFDFLVDGVSKLTAGTNAVPLTAASPGVPVVVDVTGAQWVTLKAGDGGNGNASDHAAWGGATVRCAGGSSDPLSVSVALDPATPDGAAGWYVTSPVTATVTSAPATGVSIETRTDSGAWAGYTAPVQVTGDGVHQLSARGTDTDSQVSPQVDKEVKIDATAPVVSGTPSASPRQVTVSATDATSGVASVEYRTGSAWVAYTGPVSVGPAATDVQLRATDAAGNVSSVTTVHLDAAPVVVAPTVAVALSPAAPDGDAGWYRTAPITATVTAAPAVGTTIETRTGGGSWVAYSAPVAIGADGVHQLDARATAADGQVSDVVPVEVRLDATAPVVSAAASAARQVVVSAADATSGVASIEYRTGADWALYTGPVSVGAGAADVSFRATDVAGNVSEVGSLHVDAAGDDDGDDGGPMVQKSSTRTTVITPSSVDYGAVGRLTVQVASADGALASGLVVVRDGIAQVSRVALRSGLATVALPKTLSVGDHRFTVSYEGTGRWLASQTSTTLTVVRAKANAKVAIKAKRAAKTKRGRVKVTTRISAATGVPVSGAVKVRLSKGKKTMARTTVSAKKAAATEKVVTTFARFKRVKRLKPGRYRVIVTYKGSATVAPTRVTKTVRVR